MMTWAETAAKHENISRQEADEWSADSHQKAIQAVKDGKFKEEIILFQLTIVIYIVLMILDIKHWNYSLYYQEWKTLQI